MRVCLIILSLFLAGCASTLSVTYDSAGRIDKISASGSQESSIKQEGVEVKMNTKQESPLKDFININAAKVD